MIRDESRSSHPANEVPLPGGAHPSSSSPSPPKDFPSGPVQRRALLCVAVMEIDPRSIFTVRPRPGLVNSQRSTLNFSPAPNCADQFSHFGPVLSQFCARAPQLPTLNSQLLQGSRRRFPASSRADPTSCFGPVSSQFWSSFGTVSWGPPLSTLNSQLSGRETTKTHFRSSEVIGSNRKSSGARLPSAEFPIYPTSHGSPRTHPQSCLPLSPMGLWVKVVASKSQNRNA